MNRKALTGITFCCALGVCGGFYAYSALTPDTMDALARIQTAAGVDTNPPRQTLSGDYLDSIFAQDHHDWVKADTYLDQVLLQTPDDVMVLKRVMILAMGAGESDKSMAMAARIQKLQKDDALALLFLAAGELHNKNYAQAEVYIKDMPSGSLSEFIMPLIEGWTLAGLGKFDGDKLNKNIIHLHHAILIADYLGKKDEVEKLLKQVAALQGPGPDDAERLGDLYAYLGQKDKAIAQYSQILKQWPDTPNVANKLAAMQAGKEVKVLDRVTSPEYGVAMALFNMAQLLYQENADESARVFANIALYLNPSMTDAQLLLAAITSRNDRPDDAINYYLSVKPDSEYYVESRRRAADLMEDSKRTDEALAQLNSLVKDRNDIESLIRIGDIYRREEDFQKALATYNEAAARFGNNVPKEYWYLLYVRGMSFERLGQWDKAENDLKAALTYQPDHPYVLNYLAYAWTDQGVNLDKALEMLKHASALRPSDGYITDSLGWAYYRLARYKEAVPELEQAVELLPYDPTINDHLGDAYWQAGRKMEARFQWQRAKNFSDDQSFITSVDHKLSQGLSQDDIVRQAHHTAPPPSDEAKIMNP